MNISKTCKAIRAGVNSGKMKTNFLSDAIMKLLHSRGLELEYQSVTANGNDYVHMLQCDCYETCSGGC